MTSFQKVKKIYDEDIFKDILNLPNNKNYNNENTDDNFWDIYQSDEEQLSNNLNLSGSGKINNQFSSNFKYKIKSIYNKFAKPKKENINNTCNITFKSKTRQNKKNKKKQNNSVDISMNKPRTKMKLMKVDDLSVFKRNQKWLKTKADNLNKVKEKLIKKQEKELKEYKMYKFFTKPKELDKDYMFNEENNVKFKPENQNFFIRLNKLREEKMRTPMNIHTGKINLLKLSHYSGIQDCNITPREMDKCMKYIHDKLKGKK